MKTYHRVILLGALLLQAACAASPAEPKRVPTDAEVEQYNASVPPEERIVCRDEIPVSSNIPRRVCRYIADMESNSNLIRQELMRAIR